jgi:hypothetical protein
VRPADLPRLWYAAAPAALAAFGSLLLSAAAVRATPLLNNDGIVYVRAADACARGGLAAAQLVHPWPFYSCLLAGAARVLGLGLDTAAHVLGAALLAAASAAFVLIVRELGGSWRVQAWAAVLVLTHPGLNRFRPLVVRDFGACACALLSVVVLLRYQRKGGVPWALVWATLVGAAAVFRPESAVLAAAAPLAVLADPDVPWRERTRRVLGLAALPLVGFVSFGAWLMRDASAAHVFQTGIAPYVQPMTAGFHRAAAGLAASFPLPHGREYAPYILLSGLLVVPVVKMLKVSGVLHAGLGAYALLAQTLPEVTSGARNAVGVLTSAAVLTLYGFLLKQLFVETRYALTASLLLCVWAPFAVDACLARHPSSRALKAAVVSALVLTLALGLWGLRTQEDAHVVSTLAWLEQHTPARSRIYTNSPQVAYYARRTVDWNEVYRAIGEEAFDSAALARSDFYVLRFGGSAAESARRAAFERTGARLLQSFASPAGETLGVYQRVPLAEGGAG